jgi:hypothetical protein
MLNTKTIKRYALERRSVFLKNSLFNQSLIILKWAIFTTFFAIALLFYVNNKIPSSDLSFSFVALKILFYIDTFENLTVEGFGLNSTTTNHNINLVHTFVLVLLVVIWQAVLIFKMMQTDDSIILSENISCRDYLGEPVLELRLLNDGFSTLYNINITALLRIKSSDGIHRHYHLHLKNPRIPILEVGMPYGIYIETGIINDDTTKMCLIHNGENYISEYKERDLDKTIDLLPHPNNKKYLSSENKKEIPFGACILIITEGFDKFLQQNVIISNEYIYHKLKYGRHTNIESRLEHAEKTENQKIIEKAKDRINNPKKYGKGWTVFDRDEVLCKFNLPFSGDDI